MIVIAIFFSDRVAVAFMVRHEHRRRQSVATFRGRHQFSLRIRATGNIQNVGMRAVGAQVGVPVHVGREGRGRVDDVEGHGVVEEGRPDGGLVRFYRRLRRGRVACYVVREAGEALGELGFVAGARGGHGLVWRVSGIDWGL